MPYKDKENQRKHYTDNKEIYKWRARFNKHGLSKEQIFDLIEKQNNKCALCAKPFQSMWGNDMHIDHDHETNKIRGILCMPCNVALGMLGDNEEGLSKALSYIKGELN